MKLASQVMMSTGSGICARRQMARVQPFVDDDARILPQLPGELAVADIDRIDPRGAARQQHVGEAAGRGADIEGDLSVDRDREMIERVSQLDAAPRDPRMIASLERERRIRGEAARRACRPAARRS